MLVTDGIVKRQARSDVARRAVYREYNNTLEQQNTKMTMNVLMNSVHDMEQQLIDNKKRVEATTTKQENQAENQAESNEKSNEKEAAKKRISKAEVAEQSLSS